MQLLEYYTTNQKSLPKIQSQQNEILAPKVQKQNKKDSKEIKLALAGLAVVGAVIAAGIAIKKGKYTKLSNIMFNNGKALSKDGQNFSGIIKDKLKSGDKIKLEYKNGILVNSSRTGKVKFSKSYTNINGNEIVTISTASTTKEINITQLAKDKLFEFQLNAELAQKRFEAPFEKALSNKSAKESARIFKDELIEEIEKRIVAQQNFDKNIKRAQEKFNSPFEKALSNKSAEESAQVFKQDFLLKEIKNRELAEKRFVQNAEDAQKKFNAVFENASANKSASQSAQDFFTKRTKRSTTIPYFDQKGNLISRTIDTKSGIHTKEYFDFKGNIVKRTTSKNGKEYKTVHIGDIKTIESHGKTTSGHKIYIKEKGKFKSAGRQFSDYSKDYHKKVEYLPDGISKTTVKDKKIETITYRDKKGNIIKIDKKGPKTKPSIPPIDPLAPGAEKIYASWYIHYVKLCRKYGLEVRPCGVSGGAGDHYFELLKREQGHEEWANYLKLEASRARYDEKARLMKFLREGFNFELLTDYGFTEEDIKTILSVDIKILERLKKLMKTDLISKNNIISRISSVLSEQKENGKQSVNYALNNAIFKLENEISNQRHNLQRTHVRHHVYA